MIINHNIAALVTNNSLAKANSKTEKASKRLSTGLKINTAADNAAGLAIANKMRAQIQGIQMANRNCNDAVSLIQTAEGGLSEVSNMLQRMRELAEESANDTLIDDERLKIQEEIDQLVEEIDSTAEKIQFNKRTLFNQAAVDASPFVFQIGANENNKVEFEMENLDADKLGVKNLKDSKKYTTRAGSEDAIEVCDEAIAKVSAFRARLGAFQNRLDYTSAALETSDENTQNSLSRIVDTDMAAEMTEFTTYNVITQAGIAVLSQANQRPNQLLSLLQ